MPLPTIELSDLKIQVTGPMHIGTGFARGLVNRTVVRGRDGLVYIPGSTLKGKTRDACESLARLYEISDCRAPHPQRMAQNGHRDRCLICRIFGAPARPSTLYWHRAALTPDWVKALRAGMDENSGAVYGQTTTRTQAQISRRRGLAAGGRLYTSEFAAQGLLLEAAPALTGRLALTPIEDAEDVYYELVLLLAGLKLIGALGGGGSRGAGQCEITLPEFVQVNSREVSIATQLDYVEWLQLYEGEGETAS